MNTTWILSVFLFNTLTNENQLIETKHFLEIEECISAAQLIIEVKENSKDRDPLIHYTASCAPKNG